MDVKNFMSKTSIIVGRRHSGVSILMKSILHDLAPLLKTKILISKCFGDKEEYDEMDICLDGEFDQNARRVLHRQIYMMERYWDSVLSNTVIVWEAYESVVPNITNELSVISKKLNDENTTLFALSPSSGKQRGVCDFYGIKRNVKTVFDYAILGAFAPINKREALRVSSSTEDDEYYEKIDEIQNLYDLFFSDIGSYELFEEIYKTCTSDYRFMVIDLKSDKPLQERVFWIKSSQKNLQKNLHKNK